MYLHYTLVFSYYKMVFKCDVYCLIHVQFSKTEEITSTVGQKKLKYP